MNDRLILALRPWTYSDVGILWAALLGLMITCVVLQATGRARPAHQLMAIAGALVTGTLAWQLASHYAPCDACSVASDVSPNPSSQAFFYDYVMCAVVMGVFAAQESRRYGLARAAPWTLSMFVAPLVAAPLFFLRLHELETGGASPTRPVRSLRWVYAALVVLSAPFIMPALPYDHFGALGGEFYWDGTSNQVNTYVARAVLLLFGQVFLFTLPRTRGFWWWVASLFLAFNCLAAYIALFLVFYDGRFAAAEAPRREFRPGLALGQIVAILAGNAIAALFGVTLRYTHFVIKAPEQVCREGEVTRARVLPICLADLEAALPARERAASAAGANAWARALPGETRACIALARAAIDGDERARQESTRALGRHHGSDLPSCQEAASANYAVLNECPVLTPRHAVTTSGPRSP